MSYAVSTWIFRAWPDAFVYVTHRHSAELEALAERHYLHLIPHASALLCLVSEGSLGSNEVSLELQIARKAKRPTVLFLDPQMDDAEVAGLQTVIDIWDEGYGGVIDPRHPDGERQLTDRLGGVLGRAWPASMPPGTLRAIVDEPRSLPAERSVPVPDVEAIFAGRATRKQAEQWLAVLMRLWDNRMRARGLEPAVGAMEKLFSPESQLAQLLTSYPDEVRPVLMHQLRPLVNETFRNELQLLMHVHKANPEVSMALLRVSLHANSFD